MACEYISELKKSTLSCAASPIAYSYKDIIIHGLVVRVVHGAMMVTNGVSVHILRHNVFSMSPPVFDYFVSPKSPEDAVVCQSATVNGVEVSSRYDGTATMNSRHILSAPGSITIETSMPVSEVKTCLSTYRMTCAGWYDMCAAVETTDQEPTEMRDFPSLSHMCSYPCSTPLDLEVAPHDFLRQARHILGTGRKSASSGPPVRGGVCIDLFDSLGEPLVAIMKM